jgi:hypothetical protein
LRCGQRTERAAAVPGSPDRPEDRELGDIHPDGGQRVIIDPANGAALQLLRWRAVSDDTFEVRVLEVGVRAYAFTFG